MASEPSPIDISTLPELARLADEVRTSGKPRRLRRGMVDVAMIVPATPSVETTADRKEHPMNIEQLKQQLASPPTAEERARREALLARIIEHRKDFVITPLTTADLVHQAREEEYQSYGGDR